MNFKAKITLFQIIFIRVGFVQLIFSVENLYGFHLVLSSIITVVYINAYAFRSGNVIFSIELSCDCFVMLTDYMYVYFLMTPECNLKQIMLYVVTRNTLKLNKNAQRKCFSRSIDIRYVYLGDKP